MKRCLFLVYFTLSITTAYGHAAPQVPSSIQFADIKLKLSQGARKRIQQKVNSLTKSDKHFKALLNRANLFLPIIERILKEENLPLDFKYLVMQESELVADAVSIANAIGFWQFKQVAAQEMGLEMNQHVDERMHIVAATRAAARYLKQHNEDFNNWLYAMLAYNEGRTGAQKFIQKRYLGTKTMTIKQHAHQYIIHFLAYKVAFAPVLGKAKHPTLYLYEYPEVHGKTLSEIANELGADIQKVKEHNKWLKSYRVPYDATCVAVIPMTYQQYARSTNFIKENMAIDYSRYWKKAESFPAITTRVCKKSNAKITMVNNITGAVAIGGDSLTLLAEAGNISLSQFLVLNDLDKHHLIVPGQVYYYKPKKNKANTHFHIVRSGDTWWSIAQKYGIKKKILLLKNRLHKEVPLEAGRVLWLRFIRPYNIPVAYEHPHKAAN
ncbi:MAG: transglycosylase SLT domain-containing protein [Bacteroidota bacterium]